MALAREAVLISRQLDDMPELAGSLGNLATRLSELGDAASRTEALACAREALTIHQQLAGNEPPFFLRDLAFSFQNLSERLRGGEDDDAFRGEALNCMSEAVSIWRELAERQSEAVLSNLAYALDRLGVLSQSPADKLNYGREAIAIFRQLAEHEPGMYLANLAVSLANLAQTLTKQGQPDLDRESLSCTYEATEIFRRLADSQPGVHLPYLAKSLRQLAQIAPDKAEGLRYAREAMQIYHRLIGPDPTGSLVFDFISSLFGLSTHLSAHEAAIPPAEALECARELLQMYAPFYVKWPDDFNDVTKAAADILKRLE